MALAVFGLFFRIQSHLPVDTFSDRFQRKDVLFQVSQQFQQDGMFFGQLLVARFQCIQAFKQDSFFVQISSLVQANPHGLWPLAWQV